GRVKVIFLDIDGVLNRKQTPNPRKFPFIVDPVLLGRLNRLLGLTTQRSCCRRTGVTTRPVCSAPGTTAYLSSIRYRIRRTNPDATRFAIGSGIIPKSNDSSLSMTRMIS